MTQHQMSEDDRKRLKQMVLALAVLYVMTFLSGFLQDTRFNFFNYVFFALLCLGGIALTRTTIESKATGLLRTFLVLTGASSVLLLVFYLGYEWSRLGGQADLAASLEGVLYGITLFFWIVVVGSLVLIGRARHPDVEGGSA